MAVSREHIITEIKRTAEQNGGEPLGVERFSKDTGIRYHDWCGKYWVRWNDAVKDAGFQPRDFSQPAYTESFLVEKLIELIREINKFPVQSEFRIQAQRNNDFPSDRTFRRLGKKDERIRKVLEYCKIHSGYDDVVAICEPLIVEADLTTEIVSSDDIEFGFV